MFSDSLRAESAVLPPSINVVAISEEASDIALPPPPPLLHADITIFI